MSAAKDLESSIAHFCKTGRTDLKISPGRVLSRSSPGVFSGYITKIISVDHGHPSSE